MGQVYVYRLDVTYPEGVNWLNPPAAWEPGDDPEGSGFQWPRVHPYLSRSGAKSRADLLVRYGCEVTIERSNPVTWGVE